MTHSLIAACLWMIAASVTGWTRMSPSSPRTTQYSPPLKTMGSPCRSEISDPSGPFSVENASSLKMGQFW